MSDQTSIVAGLAGGLGGGLIIIVGLAVCVYYQHRRMRKEPKNSAISINLDKSEVVTSKNPSQESVPLENVDVNPETRQQLPLVLGPEMLYTPQQPVISPVFLQPSLAFDSSAGSPNPFVNGLYPSSGEIPFGNEGPSPHRDQEPYKFGRMNLRRSRRWMAPVDQLNSYHDQPQNTDQPGDYGDFIQKRSAWPLGEAFSDGEQPDRKEKNKKSKEIQIVVEKDKRKRSRHHSDSSDTGDSSSSSSEGSSSDSDSSTESVNKLRIVKPGMDAFYLIEDGNNGKKKKNGKKHKILALIPQEPAPPPPPLPPAPVQASPPPVNSQPSPPQPMVFIIPSGNHQQAEPSRMQEFEVRPVAVPAQNHFEASSFWSVDGTKPDHGEKKPVYFKAGGGTSGTTFETQERTAQIGQDTEDGIGGFVAGRNQVESGGCWSCEVRGSANGSGGGLVGSTGGALYGGANAERTVQTTYGQSGYEEASYTVNF